MRIGVIVFTVLAASGCATLSSSVETAPAMKLYLDDDAMKAEVLQYVRPGMPVEEARELMEKNGFQCYYGRDKNPLVVAMDREFGMFCLLCSRYKQRSWWDRLFLSDEIRVYIVFEQGQVTDIRVKHISCWM